MKSFTKHETGRVSATGWMVIFGAVWLCVIILVWLWSVIEGFDIDANFYAFASTILAILFGARPVQMGVQYFSDYTNRRRGDKSNGDRSGNDRSTNDKPEPIKTEKKKPITLQEKFVATAYPEAVKASKITGIDPVFVVAQAACESAWGKSGIGTNGNNIFGIKAGRSWGGKKVLLKTTEYLKNKDATFPEVISVDWVPSRGAYKYVVKDYFRDYSSLKQAFEDHAKILQADHFAHAWSHRGDGRRFVRELQSGKLKYATSNIYVKTIHSYMDQVEHIIKDQGL